MDFLDLKLNHEDVLEICNYKPLTKAKLKQMLAYLSEHVPDWQQKSGFDLGRLVPTVFPKQVIVERRARGASARPAKPSGCLILVLSTLTVLIIIKMLVPGLANQIGRATRRPASPLNAGRHFGRAFYAPPSLSAAVAHLWWFGGSHRAI